MIVFGSRGSDLALTQTRMVAEALQARTGEEYRVEVIQTRGDRILDQPLPSIGGKGLFTAELESALRAGRIDVAVHSMKDLPVEDPPGLTIGAVPPRVDTADVLVFDPACKDPSDPTVPLARGSRVGTSSHRRRSALSALRPDLEFTDVRGNVPTRADKVRRGDYAAVVLAAAGLDRLQLDLQGLERVPLPPESSPPAPAQGALAVQCRADDARVQELLATLHDEATARAVAAERELLALLGGGCSMPLGALVTGNGNGGCRMQAALFSHPDNGAPGAGLFQDLHGTDPSELARQAAARWKALVGDPLKGCKIVLLRPDGEGGELGAALAVAGASVRTAALTRVLSLRPEKGALPDLLRKRALAFTSARAVERFLAEARWLDLTGVRVFAGGPATAAALRARGISCEVPEAGAGGAALAATIAAATPLPERGVLFPCSQERHGDLEEGLNAAGIPVQALPLYRTEPIPGASLPEAAGDAVVFTSPSGVRAYADAPRGDAAGSQAGHHVAIGATTAKAMAECGVRCDATAPEPNAAALIQTIQELRNARSS